MSVGRSSLSFNSNGPFVYVKGQEAICVSLHERVFE